MSINDMYSKAKLHVIEDKRHKCWQQRCEVEIVDRAILSLIEYGVISERFIWAYFLLATAIEVWSVIGQSKYQSVNPVYHRSIPAIECGRRFNAFRMR